VTFETSRPPFDPRWRSAFTPDEAERLAAYGEASRLSYQRLTAALAELAGQQGLGVLAAARARITMMAAHLAEVDRLRDFYGITG
jgi:hypothetical protein